jgi:hypothetical protein
VGENETETRFTVVVTGWMQDDVFEDSVTVEATDADDAAGKGVAAMERYWGHKVEVGDVTVYRGAGVA